MFEESWMLDGSVQSTQAWQSHVHIHELRTDMMIYGDMGSGLFDARENARRDLSHWSGVPQVPRTNVAIPRSHIIKS